MCGIAGYVDYNGVIAGADEYEEMLDTLRRRGPDDEGSVFYPCAAMLHARLSVVDPENGRQPMLYRERGRDLCLIYNGELYNTEEIRQSLLSKGYTFIGHSDTEVLLKAYAEWGDGCVDRFNGIFAFAVWDNVEGRLFIARDRIGVKPFFYSVTKDGAFVFGSEIKTLLKHPSVSPVITAESVGEIILLGPGRTPGSGVFKDIAELAPGCCGYFTRNGLKVRRYWRLTDGEHTDDFEKTTHEVERLVVDSIERQLVSDVPVCTFLSGGLDSSIISAVAARHMAQKGEVLHTYSVHYKDNEKYFQKSKFQPNSDDEYIDIISSYIGSVHHKIVIDTAALVDALFEATDARDLPGMADVDSSLLLFCREIKKEATVVLSGECADEIFAGYPWYTDETVRKVAGFPWSQNTSYRASFLKDDIAAELNASDFVRERYEKTVRESSILPGLPPEEKRQREMINLNFDWFMQTLLDRKDRMSMYSGLEVRVPFCDYRIAEYMYRVLWKYKYYKGREKGLLRHAVAGLLPEDIRWRKKSPYPKTHNPNYLAAVSELLRDVIASPSSPLLSIVKKSALEGLFTSDVSVPWYGQLMTVPQTIAYFVQVDYWMRKYGVIIE